MAKSIDFSYFAIVRHFCCFHEKHKSNNSDDDDVIDTFLLHGKVSL